MIRSVNLGDLVKHKRVWYLQLGIVFDILTMEDNTPLYHVQWYTKKEFERTCHHMREELNLAY